MEAYWHHVRGFREEVMKKFMTIGIAFLFCVSLNAFSGETVKILSIVPSMQGAREFYLDVAKKYEEENPGVTINFEFLDHVSFKSKLPTLLQSSEKPDAFFTWCGGVFYEQAEAGVLRDITDELDAETRARYASIGLDSMTYKNRLYGIPMYAAGVMFWYNRELLDRAGVDPDAITTWDDFIVAVEQIKNAGITPIIVGGKDKWPFQFFYGFLSTRIVGTDGIMAADRGENNGFDNDGFVRVGKEFKRLADLNPFQPGFMDTANSKAVGMFGDGRGAFHLMGNLAVTAQAKNSMSGEGLGDKLGCITFPVVTGGKGDPTDTFGGINGWLVTKDRSPSTVKFLTYLTNLENQIESGRLNLWIPIVKESAVKIEDARLRRVADEVSTAAHHQLYLDQLLGASVGAAINDASTGIATNDMTPEEAGKYIEEARQMR